jgi:hypothetical protein
MFCYDIAENGGGMVFGIPIGQCLENDRLSRIQRGGSPERDELRRKSHHGSRSSFSSLIETTTARADEVRKHNCRTQLHYLSGLITHLIAVFVFLNCSGIFHYCHFSRFNDRFASGLRLLLELIDNFVMAHVLHTTGFVSLILHINSSSIKTDTLKEESCNRFGSVNKENQI